MRLILVRHGHVDGINPPRFRGRADLALTDLGQRQAQATADYLKATYRPAAVFSSPQQRAMTTARAIGAGYDLQPEPLDEFQDIDYGDWQGFTAAQLEDEYQPETRLWYRAPHLAMIHEGEILAEVAARVIRGLGILIRRYPQSDVVVVGHDSVNRVLLLHALEMPLSKYWSIGQAPCAINLIDFQFGSEFLEQVVVERLNDVEHLRNVA